MIRKTTIKWAQLDKEQRAWRKLKSVNCGLTKLDAKGDKRRQRIKNQYDQLAAHWIKLHKEKKAVAENA